MTGMHFGFFCPTLFPDGRETGGWLKDSTFLYRHKFYHLTAPLYRPYGLFLKPARLTVAIAVDFFLWNALKIFH